jgi:hypothetical protein
MIKGKLRDQFTLYYFSGMPENRHWPENKEYKMISSVCNICIRNIRSVRFQDTCILNKEDICYEPIG